MLSEIPKSRQSGHLAAAGLAFVLVLGVTAPSVSLAATPPTEKVRIADLDLDTAKGQRAFERRLQVALDRVCERPNDNVQQTKAVQQLIDACKASARNGALQQLQTHGVRLANAARSE